MFEKLLKRHLQGLNTKFMPNELAYLALTSKVEHPIRDRLAFSLHSDAKLCNKYLIAREWKRFDLAIIGSGNEPAALVELKAMYTFDMFAPKAALQYPGKINSDREKTFNYISKHELPNTEGYTLLLATHIDGDIQDEHVGIVKYAKGIRKFGSTDMAQVLKKVESHFSMHKQSCKGKIVAGNAFGYKVSILYWLHGPNKSAA